MSTTGDKAPENTALNDQIADSISAMQNLITDNSEGDISLITYQIMAQAAGLAMLNAVNQQQQLYILQNAAIAASAKAVLESKPEETVKIINDAIKNSNVLDTFNGLKNFMDDLTKTYSNLKEKTTVKKNAKPKGSTNRKTKTVSSKTKK